MPITEGDFAPLPIAIPNFVAGTPADGEVGVGVTQVITNNLKRSGLFAPIDQAAYIDRAVNVDQAPNFQNWKTINAQALVTGRMTRQGDGRLKAEFRLWDVNTAQQRAGQQYFTSPESWRRIAHIISWYDGSVLPAPERPAMRSSIGPLCQLGVAPATEAGFIYP